MFARFDQNPAMTLRVIKETKRYGRTDARTDGRTDNVKTVYPLQTKFAGGITTTTLSKMPRISFFQIKYSFKMLFNWGCVTSPNLKWLHITYTKPYFSFNFYPVCCRLHFRFARFQHCIPFEEECSVHSF